MLFSFLSYGREPLNDQQIADIIGQFQYDNNFKEISSDLSGGSWDSCWVYKKTIQTIYPTALEPLEIQLTMYIPNRKDLGNKKIPSVIMLPPTGGINFLDKSMGNTFCSNNIAAVILENDFANIVYQADEKLLDPLDHEESYYRATAAVKAAMAMTAIDDNINSEKIGLFGVSLGGILGSFVMSTQEQISAAFIVVSGGDVPEILTNSQQDEVSRIRHKRMTEQGFTTKQEYEDFLRKYITIDPLDIARMMIPETLKMVISNNDKNVPTTNQLSLFEAYGKPSATYSNSGHVDTVVATMFMGSKRQIIANFFKERFALPNPRPPLFKWLNDFSLKQYLTSY
jgi:hypothetical protein